MKTQGKITILVGISGSGKSIFASKTVQEDPTNYTIVNRDKLRELFFGFTELSITDYYKRADLSKLEKFITKKEDTLIKDALAEGKTVIIDATHLNRDYINRYKYWNVPIELIFFNIDLKEAILRDSLRVRKVGSDIIKKQFNQFKSLVDSIKDNPFDLEPVTLENNVNLPPAIIWDIDGTIATMSGRSAYDWTRVREDKMVSNVCATLDWVNDLHDSKRPKVIIATGRDGVCLGLTKQWLADYNLTYDKIFIRKEGDMRPDWMVKEEIWREITKTNYIVGMYDDREQVVNRARALGLTVFQVAYHNF